MYIELVLFNNFFVDMLLVVCTQTIFRRRTAKLRSALAAAFGAVVATLYAVAPEGWRIAVRVLLAPIMTLIFFKPKQGKPLARVADAICATFVFCALTFLAGGVVYGLSYLFGVDISGYAALGFVAMGLCACIAFVKFLARTRNAARQDVRQVNLCAAGRQIGCTALCDSGNMLKDALTGLPVVIISDSLSGELADCDKEGYINVNTVNGESDLPLIKLDGVEIDGVKLAALGAISDKTLDGCDVILQASMF